MASCYALMFARILWPKVYSQVSVLVAPCPSVFAQGNLMSSAVLIFLDFVSIQPG